MYFCTTYRKHSEKNAVYFFENKKEEMVIATWVNLEVNLMMKMGINIIFSD